MQCDRETVRQQLLDLGYSDVPDDVVDEFVAELNQQQQSFVANNYEETATNASFSAAIDSSTKFSPDKTPLRQQAISRQEVQNQLRMMGYSEDLSEQLLDELVQELNESYLYQENISAAANRNNVAATFTTRKSPVATAKVESLPKDHQAAMGTNTKLKLTTPPPPSTVAQQKSQELKPQQKSSIKSTTSSRPKPNDENQRFSGNSVPDFITAEDELAMRFANADLTGIRRRVQEKQEELRQLQLKQQQVIQNEEALLQMHPPRPSTFTNPFILAHRDLAMKQQRKSKKADPVSNYHKYKSQWTKDSFLQRMEDPIKSKKSVFGPIGYHHLMGGQRLAPSRR